MAIKLNADPKPQAEPVNLGNMEIIEVLISDLHEYDNNPRKNDSQVPKMVELIQKFGFRQPILIQGTEVVDGHLRLKAAKALGMEYIPSIDVEDMPKADVRALRLAMNKSVEWAEWDNDKLAVEFEAIMQGGTELKFTGFETTLVDKIMKEAMNDDTVKKTAQADAGNPADPNYVSLTFHMTDPSRKKVMAFLDKMVEKDGHANRSQALIALCK